MLEVSSGGNWPREGRGRGSGVKDGGCGSESSVCPIYFSYMPCDKQMLFRQVQLSTSNISLSQIMKFVNAS
jgi:hypothetical protein